MRVVLRDSLSPKQWGMQVKEANGSTVRLSIMSSAKAIIGRYEIFFETKHKESSGEASFFRYKHEEQICVLFNAWCSGNFVTVRVPLSEADKYTFRSRCCLERG